MNFYPPSRAEKMARIFAILPKLQRTDFSPGSMPPGETVSYQWTGESEYISRVVADFAYDFSYEWTEDQESKKLLVDDRLLGKADFAAIGRLLFAVHRQDKFCENFLFCCYSDGTMLKVLLRLKALYEEHPDLVDSEILATTTMQSRLRQMEMRNPMIKWDETCEGSALSLAIFVGPSPGGQVMERRPMNRDCFEGLWNRSFDKPLNWSSGFKISWKPLVEALFSADYGIAGKLIGRANLDWISNPDSSEVDESFMEEGSSSALEMIEDCQPELVLPMDLKTFIVLKKVMERNGYQTQPCDSRQFKVRSTEEPNAKFHRQCHAFFASSPWDKGFIVMKLPQHPAKIFNADYATRCGAAIRDAARQMAQGIPIDVVKE